MRLQKREAIVFTIGSTNYLFAQWLLTVLTTRILGYEAVGILTLAMSIGNVFTFIQLFGVRSFQSSDTLRQYTPGDYLLARLTTTGCGLTICLFFCLCSGYKIEVNLSIILFTLFRTFEAISDVYFGDFQREGRLGLVGISMFVRGVLTAGMFWAGLSVFHSLNIALLWIVGISLGITLLMDTVLYRKVVPKDSGSSTGMMGVIKACFPLLLANLLPSVITAFPRLVLEHYDGAELLGYYGNISTPAVIITAVVPNILASVMPLYGEMASHHNYKGIRNLWLKTILGTVAILIICIVGVLILGKPLLAWIYTDDIVPYVPYLYSLLVSTTIYAFTMCTASVLIALRKNVMVSLCAMASTAVCLGISVPFIKFHGITGVIATLIISYSLQVGIQTVFALKYTSEC